MKKLFLFFLSAILACGSLFPVSAAEATTEKTISSNADYSTLAGTVSGNLIIRGSSASVILSLPSSISLKGNLKLSNLTVSGVSTIYANGYTLEIDDKVTSTDRLTVYGGKNGSACESTNIKIYGGQYNAIFGGGNGGAVNGNTYVTVGGNVNPSDSINDDASNYSPCKIYGGGSNAAVNGSTNVTLEGNAITGYLIGAGNSGTAKETNLFIKGGKVMNVYAGSRNTTLTNCNTHVTLTGGMAEAIFGGSEAAAMSGNTHIYLLGGQVTRRVYGGCYNDYGATSGWGSSRYVTGTTTIYIGPSVSLNTKKELSSDNQKNIGVFAGSRISSNQSAEVNTLVYLDNSYSSKNSAIGEKTSGLTGIALKLVMKTHTDYTIKSGIGGKVTSANESGKFFVEPDYGKYAAFNSKGYINEIITLSSSTSQITFEDNNILKSVSASRKTNGADVTVAFAAKNIKNETNPTIYVTISGADGAVVASGRYLPETTEASHTFNLKFTPEEGKSYKVRAFLMSEELKPLYNDIYCTL